MDELTALYRSALPARIAELEAARARLAVDAGAVTDMRRIAHALRGSGGTYGFPDVSAAAAAVEDAAPADLPQRVAALLALLRSTAG
ncbi:MAG TPA: Hpt domain-containing protein [Longimicrobiales bacterium]|nr:Hpt domain-containing protein [Longimicrobiales bacterium]